MRKELLLFIALLLMAVTSAKALEQDGSGNYLIGSVQDWKDFATLVETTPTANAKMIADINLGTDQTVIGSRTVSTTAQSLGGGSHYKGTFDGQGHTLTVAYNATGTDSASPFSSIEGATIKNLHIDGTMVSPKACGAGVASATGGTGNLIQNVWVSTTITANGQDWNCSGGIIGCVKNGDVTIEDCLFTGSITCSQSYNGCFNGYIDSGSATITNCLSTGTFTYSGSNNDLKGSHTNCYVKTYPVGFPAGVTQPSAGQLSDGTTTTALNNGRTGDDAPWMQEGSQPMLKQFALQKDGDNYYLLSSASNWKQFATIVETTPTAKAKMTADINLGDDQTVIGGAYNGSTLFYQGTFDGQGHTLTIAYNVKSGDGERFTTPFSLLQGATIKNLHLDGTVNSTYAYGGSIASILKGTNTIENIWNSVTAVCTGQSWAQMGAFIGVLGDGTTTISDCLYTGSITHDGGYSGYFNGGYGPEPTVNNCLVLGTFTGSFGFNGTYSNCYCKHASTTGVTKPSDTNLSDGTTTTSLNNGRVSGPWVQDAVSGEPRLDLFMATTSLTANEGKTGEYWATYYNGAKSCIADANTTVYTGALNGDKIDLTVVADKTIPAGNAVILKSTAANVTLTKTSAIGTLASNGLVGTDVAIVNPGNAYCLSKSGTVVGFYKFTAGGTIPAHRAYIVIPASSRSFFGFGDDDATYIEDVPVNMENEEDSVLYDLTGRMVTGQPRKGIYVRNGKKIIIK